MAGEEEKFLNLNEIATEVRRALALARLMQPALASAADDIGSPSNRGDVPDAAIGVLYDSDYAFDGLITMLQRASVSFDELPSHVVQASEARG